VNGLIFANHAHLYPSVLRENGDLDALKRVIDACGIDRCVAFAIMPDRFREAGMDVNQNVWLAQTIKNEPNLTGFGSVDFELDNLEDQVDEIAQLGFKGIKIHPPVQNLPVLSPKAFRVYAKAQELNLFLSFHTGVHRSRLRDSLPVLYDEIAYHFPQLRFSMEHIGGYGFFGEALSVIANNTRGGRQPMVFAGWTSIDAGEKAGLWSLTDEQLLAVIGQTGPERSIFGIDFPFKQEEQIRAAIERIRSLPLDNETIDLVLGGNLERELLG